MLEHGGTDFIRSVYPTQARRGEGQILPQHYYLPPDFQTLGLMCLLKVRQQVSTVPIIFSTGPVSSWFFSLTGSTYPNECTCQ